jgi:hypothetical protein
MGKVATKVIVMGQTACLGALGIVMRRNRKALACI